MKIKQINTTNKDRFQYIEKLLTESFPENEYRPLQQFRHFANTNTLFHPCIIIDEREFIGMLNYWTFSFFIYIEHFAIDSCLRGKGYGTKALSLLHKSTKKFIVLEVELPLQTTAKRRIEFYSNLGYRLIDSYYEQPPYQPHEKPLQMQLMTSDEPMFKANFKSVYNTIYREVYGKKNVSYKI